MSLLFNRLKLKQKDVMHKLLTLFEVSAKKVLWVKNIF